MELSFYKYQGTGNDFVMVDNRENLMSKNNTKLINHLCDRKFGIGSDGLILLEKAEEEGLDFRMIYFNADGNESSMCGNGGRCIIAFARFLELIEESCVFSAIDGEHEGIISKDGKIGLKMNPVNEINTNEEFSFLNTGSPHHVIFAEGLQDLDIKTLGAEIRYSELYATQGGTNVNFVEITDTSSLRIRTYERGVENETLSCGTGATAAALAAFSTGRLTSNSIIVNTEGGELQVSFETSGNGFSNIWLEGPATQVFKGVFPC